MKLTISSETQHADLIVELLPDGFARIAVEDHYRLVGTAGGASFVLTPDQAQTVLVLLDYHVQDPGIIEEDEEEE